MGYERLRKLEERERQIEVEMKAVQTRRKHLREQRRREETRWRKRRIVKIGEIVSREAAQDEETKDWLDKLLENRLTSGPDRQLFGLSPLSFPAGDSVGNSTVLVDARLVEE